MPVKLTDEQRDAVVCRNREMLVSAAAGSGKTRVIVERIMSRITGPERRNIDDFLVITFTNAAAAELRDRFEREISSRISETPSDRHLKKQLSLLAKAQITTIDAFCLSVVREFNHLCDLSPSVSIVDGAEADLLRSEALENTLESLYEEIESNTDFAELASLLSASRDDRLLAGAVSDAYTKIQSHPFPDIWMEETIRVYENCPDDFGDTVWGNILLKEAVSTAEAAKRILETALDLLKDEPSLECKYAPALRDDIGVAEGFVSSAGNGWDAAVEAASAPLSRLAAAPRDCDPVLRDRIKSMREVWKKIYGTISESISEQSRVHIDEIRRILPAIRGLFAAVKRYEREYGRIKSSRNLVDFNDVSHAVIKLLCRRSGELTEPTEVAELIGGRYAEVLIDEFQDTNGIQTLIADMLTRGRNNLFMVGDVKQSIYRFRLAEPEIFISRYNTYKDYSDALGDGVPVRMILSKNFRSRPEVVDAVNSVFKKLMVGGFTQISYGEREKLHVGRVCAGDPADDGSGNDYETSYAPGGFNPEFMVIDIPEAEDDEEDSVGKLEAEAAYVAKRIRSMLDGGFQVEEDGIMRNLRPGDIAILLRSASSKASYFERALSANGIESCTERSGPIRTAELLALLSLLKVIDNAYQDIPLIGVMNLPIYRFTPDELTEIRSADRSASMYDAVRKSAGKGNEKCKALIESLSSFRTYAAENGIDRLIRHVYSVTGLPGIFSAMAGGAERRRNLMRLYEHAAKYVSSGRHGISGFINYIERTMENGTFGSDEAFGDDAVRIMTIHKSKGMEFPVVFICDISCKFNLDDTRKPVLIHPKYGIGLRILDQDRMYQYPTAVYTAISRKLREESLAEEMRILYVAMTRAKEKLIMTCALPGAAVKLQSILKNADGLGIERIRSADGPAKWLVPILASHPSGARLREISGSDYFSADEPGTWITDVITAGFSDEPETGREDDTAVQRLKEASGSSEVKASEELPPDVDELAVTIRERLDYRYPFAGLSQVPSKITATQLKGKAYESELTENAEVVSRPLSHLRRPRFAAGITGLTPAEKGTALHLAMQFADIMKCRDRESIEKEIGRLRESRILSGLQADAVDPEKILRFVESDLGKRVYAAKSVKREFKFSILDEAGRYYPDAPAGEKLLVQGVCDLFFEEDDGIVVVDFKSDKVSRSGLSAKAGEYRPQVELYAYALEKITGKTVKEKFLYFFSVDEAFRL